MDMHENILYFFLFCMISSVFLFITHKKKLNYPKYSLLEETIYLNDQYNEIIRSKKFDKEITVRGYQVIIKNSMFLDDLTIYRNKIGFFLSTNKIRRRNYYDNIYLYNVSCNRQLKIYGFCKLERLNCYGNLTIIIYCDALNESNKKITFENSKISEDVIIEAENDAENDKEINLIIDNSVIEKNVIIKGKCEIIYKNGGKINGKIIKK